MLTTNPWQKMIHEISKTKKKKRRKEENQSEIPLYQQRDKDIRVQIRQHQVNYDHAHLVAVTEGGASVSSFDFTTTTDSSFLPRIIATHRCIHGLEWGFCFHLPSLMIGSRTPCVQPKFIPCAVCGLN